MEPRKDDGCGLASAGRYPHRAADNRLIGEPLLKRIWPLARSDTKTIRERYHTMRLLRFQSYHKRSACAVHSATTTPRTLHLFFVMMRVCPHSTHTPLSRTKPRWAARFRRLCSDAYSRSTPTSLRRQSSQWPAPGRAVTNSPMRLSSFARPRGVPGGIESQLYHTMAARP
jgi:hypothetical protein